MLKRNNFLIIVLALFFSLTCNGNLFNNGITKNGIKKYNKLFLYTANRGSNKISGHVINISTGELTSISSSPWDSGSLPVSISADPSGRFIYTANYGSNNVYGYSINQSTGELTAITGSPWDSWTQPRSLAVEYTGKFIYVTNTGDQNISGYNIDQNSGALTDISGSPWKTYNIDHYTDHYTLTIDPGNKFIYVCDNTDVSEISGYVINQSNGTLANCPYSPYVMGCIPSSALVSIASKYLYVTAYNCSQVKGFNINSDTGDITSMTSGAFTSGPVSSGPSSLAQDTAGKFVYALNCVGGTIAEYTINKNTGALAPISPTPDAPMPAGAIPSSITVEPTGTFAYVANYNDNNISGYVINQSTGKLTVLTNSPWSAGTNPAAVVVVGIE